MSADDQVAQEEVDLVRDELTGTGWWDTADFERAIGRAIRALDHRRSEAGTVIPWAEHQQALARIQELEDQLEDREAKAYGVVLAQPGGQREYRLGLTKAQADELLARAGHPPFMSLVTRRSPGHE